MITEKVVREAKAAIKWVIDHIGSSASAQAAKAAIIGVGIGKENGDFNVTVYVTDLSAVSSLPKDVDIRGTTVTVKYIESAMPETQ